MAKQKNCKFKVKDRPFRQSTVGSSATVDEESFVLSA